VGVSRARQFMPAQCYRKQNNQLSKTIDGATKKNYHIQRQ
jgi:hypothetical protein